MNNWWKLFLTPGGHIGRRSFWHGWLVLTALNVTLLGLGARLTAPEGQKAFALILITLYPTVCLYAKRLHGLGKSGWLQAPSRLIWALCLATPLLPRSPGHADMAVAVLYALGLPALIWDAVLFWWSATGEGIGVEEAAAAAFD